MQCVLILREAVCEECTNVPHQNESENDELTADDIKAALQKYLPGELKKHALAEATKAMCKYLASQGSAQIDEADPYVDEAEDELFARQSARLQEELRLADQEEQRPPSA